MPITSSNEVEKKRLEIVSYLKKLIKNRLEDGEKLPSENTLSKQFDVNRNTVRSALLSLKVQGLVYSEKGKGFFAIKKPAKFMIKQDQALGLSEILDKACVDYSIKLLNITKKKANEKECSHLKLNPEAGENVFILEQLRYISGVPFALCYSIMPEKLVPELDLKLITGKYSFSGTISLFRDVYGYDHPVCTRTSIQSFPPSEKDMNNLLIPDNIPILQQENLYVIDSDVPVEYFVIRGRSDMFKVNFSF